MHDENAQVSGTAASLVVPEIVVPEIVSLPAEIDLNKASSIGAELRAAIHPGAAVVIADMTRTVFVDSSGIRHLLDRAREFSCCTQGGPQQKRLTTGRCDARRLSGCRL